MACCGICTRYETRIAHTHSYTMGYKYCRICTIFIKHEGAFCPCCNRRLKTKPRRYGHARAIAVRY